MVGLRCCYSFQTDKPTSIEIETLCHGEVRLVAGATDERIMLINDNASCAGGSAAFRYVGDGGETIDIINAFPSWFGTGLRPYLEREEDIPFDQHCLLASMAPRPLLLTYALDDRWSNPEGKVQCAWAAGILMESTGGMTNEHRPRGKFQGLEGGSKGWMASKRDGGRDGEGVGENSVCVVRMGRSESEFGPTGATRSPGREGAFC
jgi:hypothetical protein